MTSDTEGTPITPQGQSTPDISRIQEIAGKAGCVVHHYPHHYIVVVEDLWAECDESTPITERKPFIKAFPDNKRGLAAMHSALMRRFPALVTPSIFCAACSRSKPYVEFDARFLGKNTRKVCQECRESQQRTANERYQHVEANSQAMLDAARSDYISRFPLHEYQFRAAYSLTHLRTIAKKVETEQQAAVEWKEFCLALGFTKQDMRHTLEIHSLLSYSSDHKEQWNEFKERFLALTPPYYGALGLSKSQPLSRDETALLYDLQEGHCAYCHVKLLPLSYRRFRTRMVRAKELPDWDGQGDEMELLSIDADRMAQIEHRIPIARGGNNDKSNLVMACRACNLRKGVRTDDEFACLPNDAISQLGTSPQNMLMAMEYERRGYTRFGEVMDYARSSVIHRVVNEIL